MVYVQVYLKAELGFFLGNWRVSLAETMGNDSRWTVRDIWISIVVLQKWGWNGPGGLVVTRSLWGSSFARCQLGDRGCHSMTCISMSRELRRENA